jgi:chromosome segregation ATPase
MKYKYFFIFSLAVCLLFGQTTFAIDDTVDIKQLSPWWLDGIPEPNIVAEFDNLEAELDVLSNNRNRYALMEEKFTASKQMLSEDLASQEKIVQDLEIMRVEISQNIIKNNEKYKELDEDLVYLTGEIEKLKKKQIEMANVLKKLFTQ